MTHEPYPTDDPAVVTCGLPYATGDLHIGHLRGYVGADVFARSLRRLGQDTAYVCGTDMHGTPVAVQALQEEVDPETLALKRHEQYQETFPRFDIEYDNYGHTHDDTNIELTLAIVEALEAGGYIYEDEVMVAWDPEEDQPLPDRFVEGTCPYCGATARGDECDDGCQRHLEPGEIEAPTSTLTGNPAEYRERTHKFFRLSELQDYLASFLDRLEGTSNAQNQPREWIEGDLQDWCITRDMDWGIDYPGRDDLVLYVWVDAPIEYIASTKQYSDRVGLDRYDWQEVWKEDGEIIHIIGRDIIQHHTIFWPAMLHVAGYSEPRAVVAHGFMSLDGEAFSTSRNRAVWAQEYLDEGFHPDLLRYYLVTVGGIQDDIDFSWDRFQERVNGELVGNVGNFVYRSLLFANRNWDGTPEQAASEEVLDRIETAIETFRSGLNSYSIRDATQAGVELADFGNEYIQRHEPWKLIDDDPDAAATVIRDCVQLVKATAVLLQPTIPGFARTVWADLGESGSIDDVVLETALEAPPSDFGEPTEPFERIEDDHVDRLNAELETRVATDSATTEAEGPDHDEYAPADVEPISDDRISFEEFSELDLRVGEILAAEPIPDADELVRLDVDLGVEERQIVAGLRQLHDIESLPGTRIVIVANLEPTELFGIESNGMLLAAGEEADLLTTIGDAPVGTRVQ